MSRQDPRVALITDSTCDIPTHLLEQHDIHFASQHLIWGTEEYRDRIDISTEEFYTRLAKDTIHPKSSQPVANDFVALIEKARQAGAEEVVLITISSQLSGTIESARQAKDRMDIPVYLIDSLAGGMALGWQVLAAARAREAGGNAQAMIAAADKARQTMQFVFFVDSLDYLHKGGRIGGAAKLIGLALNLKPLLYVNHTVGRIEPGEKIRTRHRAMERIYRVFFEQMLATSPVHVAVAHSNALDDAEALANRIRETYDPVELLVTAISPVMGTHIGPGAVGIAGYYES